MESYPETYAEQDGELPKKKSFADLGLDSLGFVSEDDGEDNGDDAPSPLTQRIRERAEQRVASESDAYAAEQARGYYEYQPNQERQYDDAGWAHHQQYVGEYHPHQQQYAPQYEYYGGHDNDAHPGVNEYGYEQAWDGHDDGGEMDERQFLSLLMESFPGYSLESLEELLAANNHYMEMTVEMLTEMDTLEEPPEPPSLDDESNFPSLGGGSGGPEAPPPPIEVFRSFTISGGRSNMRLPSPADAPRFTSADENGNFAARVRTQSAVPQAHDRGSVQVGYGTGNFRGGSSAASHQPWVETGEAVSDMYAATREDARDHMRMRNICFQQATQAYLSGNKALAKELSRKGRGHAQAMRAAHDEAAVKIFRERNSNTVHSSDGSDGRPRLLDMHGLHCTEAVAVLRRELPNCRAAGDRVVHVLVGTGHHVKGSRTPSRLPVAVAEYLSSSRIRFWEPQAGMLEVDVQSVF